jgi:hypothetical protein
MLGSAGGRTLYYGNPTNRVAPLNKGLVGWWKVVPLRMSGKRLLDMLGRFDATFVGVAAGSATSGWGSTQRPGGWGEVRFDGTDDYLDAGSAPALDDLFGTVPGTVAFWLKPNAMGNAVILGKNDNNGVNAGWFFENITSVPSEGVAGLRFNIERTSANMRLGCASPPDKVWTHIAAVADGTLVAANQKLYYNGVLQTPTTTNDGTGTHGSDAVETLFIGNNRPAASATVTMVKYKGSLDDIRLYNRALSTTEMAQLYATSLVGYPQELNWLAWPPAFTQAPAVGRTTKNTRSAMLGMLHGMQRGIGIGRAGVS